MPDNLKFSTRVLLTCVETTVIGVVLICAIGGISVNDAFGGILLGIFVGLVRALSVDKQLLIQQYRAQDYRWYVSVHPEALKGAKLTCTHCGGDRIHTRALMNRTYTRSHVCTQCGETLYYSAET